MSKTLAPSVVTSRDPKGTKFISILEQAYNKAKLNEAEAQRVNDTPGLSDLVATFIAENRTTGKYKDEEEKSEYGYLSGYEKPQGLTQQANTLRILFSGIGFTNRDYLTKNEKGEITLPEGAEGWFAIPNWIKNPKIFGVNYSSAVQKVLDKIKETRGGKFYNYREGQIDEKHLRESAWKKKFFEELSVAQSNPDILIVAGQFGFRHRGRSVRRAIEVMKDTAGEFGLGTFANGIMLLTHENRLKNYDDLWIDCAGDEFSPDAGGEFSKSPYFRFHDGRVGFDARYVCRPRGHYGAASGFLPQN